MTTSTTTPATGGLPALQTGAGSWCGECDGRPCRRVAACATGAAADRLAHAHGEGAHVHYRARRDEFVVVTNRAMEAA